MCLLAAQGWIVFRSKEFLPDNLVFHDSYLGIDQISFTLNFSKRCSSQCELCPFLMFYSAA